MYTQQPIEVKIALKAPSNMEIKARSDAEVMPGWMCLAIGVGFIALVVVGLVGALVLAS